MRRVHTLDDKVSERERLVFHGEVSLALRLALLLQSSRHDEKIHMVGPDAAPELNDSRRQRSNMKKSDQ